MVAKTGEPFEGRLHDPQRSGLHPASDKQYVTVACDGYAVWKSPMFDRSLFVRELGLIVVAKPRRANGAVEQRDAADEVRAGIENRGLRR